MFYIEVDNAINKIITLYHRLGIWKHEEKIIYHGWGRKLFHLIVSVSFVVSLISGAFQSDDWNDSIFLVTEAVVMSVIIVKLFYILWRKNQILLLLHDIAVHCTADCETYIQINKKLKKFSNFVHFFCVFFCFGIIAFVGLPIFSNVKKLPFDIGFPLDWKNNEISFWIAYSYLVIVIVFVGAYILITIIVWYILLNCSIKYQILETEFKNLGACPPKITSTIIVTEWEMSQAEKQNFFVQELIELTKKHQSIQETIDRFKCCFDKLFLVQLSTSGICLCGSIYMLVFSSHEDDVFQSGVYVAYLTYNIFDIFMVMYFGNEIKWFSGRLSYGLFQSDWINQSKSCKECILILMEVLKRPHELVIWKLYPLNLETFTAILNFAYSSFNILKSFK